MATQSLSVLEPPTGSSTGGNCSGGACARKRAAMAATSISSSAMPTRAVLVCTDATTTSTRMQSRADGSIVICTIQRWIYGSMDLESRASEPRDSATGAVPSVKKTNQHSSHVARGSVHDAFRRLWRGRRGTVVGAVHAAGQAERPHVRLAFLLQLNSARGARTLGSKKASAPLFLAEGPPGGGWDGHATEAAAGAAMAFCRGQV